MDNRLGTSFDAGNVVAHGVKAGLGGVHFDNLLELALTSREFVFPEGAKGFAFFHHEGFGVLGIGNHLVDKVGFVEMR